MYLMTKSIDIFYTFLGILTILLWTSNNYPFRSMLHNFGTFSGIGMSFGCGGVLGLIIFNLKKNVKRTKINKTSITMIILYVVNMIFSSLSFGLSPVGDVLLQASLINATWVITFNICLVTMLNYGIRYKCLFYSGILLSVIGIIVSCVGFNFEHINFVSYFPKYYYCYIFATIGSITWTYYSVYLNKYSEMFEDDHIFIGMILTGIISIVISFCDESFNNYENYQTDFKNIGFLLYEIIILSYMSYYFWGISLRYGNVKIISNFSLFAPVLNTLFTSIFYGLNLFGSVVFGSIILVIAVICCKYSITNEPINNDADFFSMEV